MSLGAFPHAMPLEGLLGGLMIGVAAALLLLGSGRIAGVSGMTARSLLLTKTDTSWSTTFLFLLGLPLGAFLFQTFFGPLETSFPTSSIALIAGGLLVGFGTRLGSGCTSGHGVCGMSRGSKRSIIATFTFISSGIVTVALINFLG